MATINSQNNTLTSSSGSGSFVGSTSPVLTAADFGGADTFKIPSAAAPSLSSVGSIAVDTTISSFNAMLLYRTASQSLIGISIPSADLSGASNGQLIGYNSAGQKLTLINSLGVSTQILGYNSANSSSDDTTTSTSAVNTSLTVNYTPLNASSILYIFLCGAGSCTVTGANARTQRYATYIIRRTTGSAANLATANNGRILTSSTLNASDSYYNVCLATTETAGDTNVHTYTLQHNVNVADTTTTFLGSTCRAFIVVWELKV